jgi:hypothetical protein
MDLCIDGNISQTFGPDGATQYFARLLRVDAQSIRATGSQEWARAFFITNPMVQNSPPSIRIDGQPAWLLDYAIQDVGTVVPQHIWSAPNPSDFKRYGNVPLNMPIFFVHKNRINLGLPLLRAAVGDCKVLLSLGAAAPVGGGSTTYMRINVSIFPCCSPHQIERKRPLSSGQDTSIGVPRSCSRTRLQHTTQLPLRSLQNVWQVRCANFWT